MGLGLDDSRGIIRLPVEASSFSSTWVSFYGQAGSCLRVTSAAMYLGMASSMRSWGRSLHGG
ncbi:UNVERIFIED_CONTAM: hypothetical protein Sradi_0678900 [Sesamum radiatum]|uniref:Uncharacterized protein n=1 Tax=Sesamum radiatum TaxID=300843 RepID=A0AAW2VNB5_SESRA